MSVSTLALGDVADFIRGITFKPGDVRDVLEPSSVVCLRTKNVQSSVDLDDLLAVSPEFVRREEQYLQMGDILISSANSWNLVGKCCWIPELPWPASFGGFVTVLRPNTASVDRRYLFHWFSYERTQQQLRSFGRKTTNISNLNLERCRTMEFPVPPIEEQRRIAAVLDAADALRAKRREALAQLDALTQAIFVDMFGDPVSNPLGWREDRVLADVAEVRSGITKGRKTGDDSLASVPYLAVVNVQDGFIELDPLKSIDATTAEIEKYALSAGDILLTEGGDADKLGRGAVWNGQVEPCIHQNHVFRVRLVSEDMTPEFLSRVLASQRGKRYFLRMAKQTTGIASINMTQLRGFPLLEPPRATQDEFLNRISCVEETEARLKHSASQLNALFASLQQRAFRGEL